jgi:hypothetical protein
MIHIHLIAKFDASILGITALTSLPHFLVLKVLRSTGITVPEAQVGNGVVGLGTFQTSDGVGDAVVLHALVETLVQ